MSLNKTSYFTEFKYPGILFENKERLYMVIFEKTDVNKDGFITEEEIEKIPKMKGARPPRKNAK